MSIIGCVKQFGPHGDTNTAAALNITDKGLSIMAKHQLPSPALLRQLLDYDPETGILTWRKRSPDMFLTQRSCSMWNTRYAGQPTGASTCSEGYMQVSILSVKQRAHRVAWAIYHGTWPDGELDHKNRNPSDNRIDNLRIATPTVNARNKGEYSNNKSGYRGVTWHKSSGKWMSQIKLNKKNIHLGLFDCPKEAGEAYKVAATEYYGREYVE